MKEFIKMLLPIGVLELRYAWLKKKSRAGQKPPYRFEIHKDKKLIEIETENVWKNSNWTMHVTNYLNECKEKPPLNDNILPLITAIKLSKANSKSNDIKVFDIGGGCGALFTSIQKYVKDFGTNASYHTIDDEDNIEIGKKAFADEEDIFFIKSDEFYNNSDASYSNVEVVNISSTIQYVLDWRSWIEEIIKKCSPQYVVVSRFPSCTNANSEAYGVQDITTSLGYCGATKVVLFKDKDLESHMDKIGYECVWWKKTEDYEYFWEGASHSEYTDISAMSYLFVKKSVQ